MSKIESRKFRRSLSGINGEEFHLETYLWESANILRGHVDASDFKAYIFPLLFYKRISDVYDEEYQNALKESDGDEEYAQSEVNHRFVIPEGCHWSNLRNKTKNIGRYLQKSLRTIEKSNPTTLFGIFGDANWGNQEKITDELMVDLVEQFSKIHLSNSKINQDLLGDAYEYLIKKFADLQNKKAGEFYTPRTVVNLLVRILDPNDDETIYDPACGTGGMLLETANIIKKKNQDVRKLRLFGQESNLNTAAIARINLFLHGLDDFKIKRGDTLRDPQFIQEDTISKFDCVIANPPFSLKEWGYEVWKNDPYGRAFAGLPPKNYGDFAWVEHMVSSMTENGKTAVVLSSGSLFRESEQKIRKHLIENDLITSVIQLGPNLFYGTPIAPCVLILKNKKSKFEKNNVFMINASLLLQKDRAQNYLLEEHVNEIFSTEKNRKEITHFSKNVSMQAISEKNYNLSVSKYVETDISEKILPLKKTSSEFIYALNKFKKSEKILKKIINEELHD